MPINGIDYVGSAPQGSAGEDIIAFNALVAYTNRSSTDDAYLNREELRSLFSSSRMDIGQDLSDAAMDFIIRVYGNGHVISKNDIIDNMISDGFIKRKSIKTLPFATYVSYSLDWNKIRGDRIASAVYARRDYLSNIPEVASFVRLDSSGAINSNQLALLLGSISGLYPENSTVIYLTGSRDGLNAQDAIQLSTNFGDIALAGGGRGFDRTDIASLFDTNTLLLSFRNDVSHVIINTASNSVIDVESAINFIMSAGDATYDRMLTSAEFGDAIFDLRNIRAPLDQTVIKEMMDMYGRNVNGTRVLAREDIARMFSDTVLTYSNGSINVNHNIAPVERVVDGASLDDDMLDRTELIGLFQTLGIPAISDSEADFILNIYGNGHVVAEADILRAMPDDGFLTLNRRGINSTIDWNRITPDRMAKGFMRTGIRLIEQAERKKGNNNPVSRNALSRDEFAAAMNQIFGVSKDKTTRETQENRQTFLVRMFGSTTGSTQTVNAGQIANMFTREALDIRKDATGPLDKRRIGLIFDMKENDTRLGSTELITKYFASFSTLRTGNLTIAEMTKALNAFKASDTVLTPAITGMMAQKYHIATASSVDFSAAEIAALFTDEIISLGTGGSQGFKINLGNASNKDLAVVIMGGKSEINASELRAGLGVVARYKDKDQKDQKINESQANWLMSVFGSKNKKGTLVMNAAQVREMFDVHPSETQATLGRLNVPNKSLAIISLNFQVTTQPHHHRSWWNTAIQFVEGGLADFMGDLKRVTKWEVPQLAALLNGTMTAAQANAAGSQNMIKSIGKAIRGASKAEQRVAHKVIDSMHKAIIAGIGEVSDLAKGAADELVKLAKDAGNELAIATLTMMTGMSSTDAKAALEKAGTISGMTKHLSSLTQNDLMNFVPSLNDIVSDLKGIASDLAGVSASGPGARPLSATATPAKTLQASGVTAKGRGTTSGIEDPIIDNAQWRASYFNRKMRLDYTLEYISESLVPNKFRGAEASSWRAVTSYPKVDKDGDIYIEFRLRFLDAGGLGFNVADIDTFGVKDFKFKIYVNPKVYHKFQLDYVSTSGVLAEAYVSKGAAKDVKWLLEKIEGSWIYKAFTTRANTPTPAYQSGETIYPEGSAAPGGAPPAALGTVPVDGVESTAGKVIDWIGNAADRISSDIEFGASGGISTSYTLYKQEKQANGSTRVRSVKGVVVGVMLAETAGYIGGYYGMAGLMTLIGQPELAADEAVRHVGGDLGVFGADMAFAGITKLTADRDLVDISAGVGAWAALKTKLTTNPIENGQAGLKTRVQFNWSLAGKDGLILAK